MLGDANSGQWCMHAGGCKLWRGACILGDVNCGEWSVTLKTSQFSGVTGVTCLRINGNMFHYYFDIPFRPNLPFNKLNIHRQTFIVHKIITFDELNLKVWF